MSVRVLVTSRWCSEDGRSVLGSVTFIGGGWSCAEALCWLLADGRDSGLEVFGDWLF